MRVGVVSKEPRWQRVPFDASAEDGGTIIRIKRGTQGDVMASVEQLEWFEPDGHQHTGYAASSDSHMRPAPEVLSKYRQASVALESDDFWNPAWGVLVD